MSLFWPNWHHSHSGHSESHHKHHNTDMFDVTRRYRGLRECPHHPRMFGVLCHCTCPPTQSARPHPSTWRALGGPERSTPADREGAATTTTRTKRRKTTTTTAVGEPAMTIGVACKSTHNPRVTTSRDAKHGDSNRSQTGTDPWRALPRGAATLRPRGRAPRQRHDVTRRCWRHRCWRHRCAPR